MQPRNIISGVSWGPPGVSQCLKAAAQNMFQHSSSLPKGAPGVLGQAGLGRSNGIISSVQCSGQSVSRVEPSLATRRWLDSIIAAAVSLTTGCSHSRCFISITHPVQFHFAASHQSGNDSESSTGAQCNSRVTSSDLDCFCLPFVKMENLCLKSHDFFCRIQTRSLFSRSVTHGLTYSCHSLTD